ncbi:hypothetical protein AB0I30_33555 [Nocardia tengchongensis]|uniref:hypothetical protein n=1 Tax=Nocardia tengchongensis TaxID=2055889 RepID=UPI0033E4D045
MVTWHPRLSGLPLSRLMLLSEAAPAVPIDSGSTALSDAAAIAARRMVIVIGLQGRRDQRGGHRGVVACSLDLHCREYLRIAFVSHGFRRPQFQGAVGQLPLPVLMPR